MARRNGLLVWALLAAMLGVTGTAQANCVHTVRALTDFTIRGNAGTWWDQAAAHNHARGQQPAVGSVMAFPNQPSLRVGHVAVVSGVEDARTIYVDHSWGGSRVWRDMKVVDISPANDWSEVRVWHGPTNTLGITEYRVSGFIYPDDRPRFGDRLMMAENTQPLY